MFGCTGSNRVGIPCYEWLKRGMLSSFRKNYSAIGDAMFKGGLMEPNGILCEVQPVL